MRNTRLRLWLALALAVILTALAALIGLGAVVAIFSPWHRALGGDIVIAVLSIAVVVACVRWAVHTEHRLRSHQTGGAADATRSGTAAGLGAELDAALSAPARRPARTACTGAYRARLYHHRHGPVATAVGGVILTLVAIGMVIGTVVEIGAWRHSRFVQAHGDRRAATVLSVHEAEHHGKYSTWYTADIGVLLNAPAGGHLTTTAHYPGWSTLVMGDQVVVLVDPGQPGYAELPGSPYTTQGTWIALLVFAVFTAPFACLYWYEVIAVRIRRRRGSAQARPQLSVT